MKKLLAAFTIVGIVAMSALAANLLNFGDATGATPNNRTLPLRVAAVATAPSVTLTAPASNAVVSSSVTLRANASDAKKVKNVQFQLDGVNLGAADTTAPYSINWNTHLVSNGSHALTAIATNSSNLSTTSGTVMVTVNNTDNVAPTVSITSPANGASIGGVFTVAVSANDNVGVTRVVLSENGNVIRNATNQNAYGWGSRWNTANVTDGSYTLTAVAYDAAGNTSSTSNTVTVSNNPTAPVAPNVSITAPVANATVAGSTTVSATAGGTQAITGVQFKLDGVNLGAAVTTAPYSVNWNTTTATNGSHVLTAVATNSSLLSTTSAPVTVTVNNPTPPTAPTVAFTAPANGSNLTGTTAVTATAGGTTAISSVQFQLDGVNLGAAVTTAPYSVNWNTTTATNGSHVLTAVATNAANLTASSSVTVNVNNPTAPTVAITAPAVNATVSGATVAVTANASDAQSVTSVQFQLDGVNLGAAVTTAPYSVNWNTTTATNGSHVLTAVATNNSNLSTTSASVSVVVNNQVVTPPASPNLILNPSVETAQDANTPASWLASNWGTNTTTFSYLNTGHTGTRSVEVATTAYTNGAANWYYADIPVTAGKTYQYTNWYQSNVDTEVDAQVTMTDGTVQYFWIGTVPANTNWTKFTSTFTVPAGGKSMAVYQILAKTGYIISDDYSLSEYTPLPFNRGIVSVSFDDGWTNQYNNARPVMQQDGLIGTYNIISGELTDQPDYMSVPQIQNLINDGNEIASHTVTHPDLTTLTQAQMVQEMTQSKSTLESTFGITVTDFAYPFGAYNASTLAVGAPLYQSQRTVNRGYNTKDNLDLTQLKIYEVDSNISQAQVQGWIDGAVADHSWLILVFHEIAVTPSDPTDALYDTQPTDFAAEMLYLKNSGAAVETVHQAINEVLPQL